MGRPFAANMDIVAFPMHLKIKYHNLQKEPNTLNADLEGAKIMYQVLQRYKGKGVAMEINMFP